MYDFKLIDTDLRIGWPSQSLNLHFLKKCHLLLIIAHFLALEELNKIFNTSQEHFFSDKLRIFLKENWHFCTFFQKYCQNAYISERVPPNTIILIEFTLRLFWIDCWFAEIKIYMYSININRMKKRIILFYNIITENG